MADTDNSGETTPAPPINALIVEDDCQDAALCLRILQKSRLDIHCEIAKTREEFVSLVSARRYDVILCDYNVGGWTALDALNYLQSAQYEVPFILVTGALGDEKAVECMRKGMADYILKDRLQRLPLAIVRSLEAKAARDEHQRLVQETEERCRLLLETIPDAVFLESGSSFSFVNQAAEDLTGYTRDELLKMRFIDLLHEESRESLNERGNKHPAHHPALMSRAEIKLLTKGGDVRWLETTMSQSPLQTQMGLLITAFDITERKRAEQQSSDSRDPLTGLANYARMTEVFDLEAGRTDRTTRPFALLLLRLNGIKEIKAQYGFLVAQRALCRVARVMCLHSRSLDSAFRLGEDEFGFILPETGPEGAPVLGRRITARLADDNEEPSLEGKFGVAIYPRDGKTIDQALRAARRQLNPTSSDLIAASSPL